MARYIDADLLISRIKPVAEYDCNDTRRNAFKEIFVYVLNMPTAYDVEAVVAELEKYAEENKGERMQDGIGSCVRIVRGKE